MTTRRGMMRLAGAVLGTLVPMPFLRLGANSLGQDGEGPLGAVQALSGWAFAERGEAVRRLVVQAPVTLGDLVRTGEESRLSLSLGGRTTLNLGALTRLRIEKFLAERGGVITLESGGLFFDKPEKLKSGNIAVNSPFGVIAVRGTRFFAGPSAGVFGVFVEHGLVEVTAAGKTVQVSPGYGTNIEKPGVPPSDPAPWGAGRITSALASVR